MRILFLASRTLSNPFDAGQGVVYYEPDRSLGARIVAQRSVFVICNPLIPDQHLKSVVVPRESKGLLEDYLTRLGLSQTALFGDVPGLAAANTTRTQLQRTGPLTPEQHWDRGNRAYQAGRYDDALAAYESYAAALPDVAQPHCLMGDALAALGRYKDANLVWCPVNSQHKDAQDFCRWQGAMTSICGHLREEEQRSREEKTRRLSCELTGHHTSLHESDREPRSADLSWQTSYREPGI